MQPHSRRTFLALGLLTLTACTSSPGGADPDGGAKPGTKRPGPDEPVRLRAVAATDTLLSAYDTLLAAPGAQTALLQPLRAETAQHRAALADGVPAASAPPSPTAAPAPTAQATSATQATLAALAALERQTAESRLADLGTASPDLARLLASVATAGTLHAAALGDTTASDQSAPSPTGTPTTPPASGSLPALQAALAAEHAAVYGYGVVGAHLPEDQQRTDARTAYAAHQSQRDAWQRLVTVLGATPTPAAGGYQLPFPVTDPASATRLAAYLETRLTTVYADLVSALPAPQRADAATALRACAHRARRWGAPSAPFPGIPDPFPGIPDPFPSPTRES